jgi:fatty-acyl-CoA synthase
VYLLLWLACARGGFIHVPVNYALTGDELLYVISQSGARAIFADEALMAQIERVATQLCETRVFLLAGNDDLLTLALQAATRPVAFTEPDIVETDIAQIMYTSGTTSLPKGAMMSHGALLSQYLSCIYTMDFRPDDRSLAALPLYHAAQMHGLTTPLMLAGGSTHLIEAPVPQTVLALIEARRITSFFAPPTVVINLLCYEDFDRRNLASLRKIYYGASIMPGPVLEELRRRLPGAQLYNCYGQTEMAPLATVLFPHEHEARPASCGRPVINVETRIVDEQMQTVGPNERGEIVHRSPHLFSGYWSKPEETAAAFAGGWFHSGDVGYMDEEGYVYVVDRIKDVINTGGVLVASREVEDAIYTHPAVAEVAVIGVPDAKWIEAVVAVVVLRKAATATADELIAHARARLAPYKTPKRVTFADSLPKNASGKILKRELRAGAPPWADEA